MEKNTLTRTELVIGKEGLNKLKNSKVVIFGVGGVGGFATEALTRAGIGEIVIVDNDTVDITNLNRQIIATYDTVDKVKVEVMRDRINSINKECKVTIFREFVTPENIEMFLDKDVDYVVDAIDTVTAKIALAKHCYENNIKIMSSMGTGNKMDPTQFKVSDIHKTKVCPLAKVMRSELKKRGVKKLKVVYSEEIPAKPNEEMMSEIVKGTKKRQTPGSMSFVPPVAGMIIASEVVKDILKEVE